MAWNLFKFGIDTQYVCIGQRLELSDEDVVNVRKEPIAIDLQVHGEILHLDLSLHIDIWHKCM